MGSMRKSRLSLYKQSRLIEHFVAETTARIAAGLCGVHRNTAAYYFLRLREIIAYELEAESEAMFGGEIGVDESYFGGKRKGKRGRLNVKCYCARPTRARAGAQHGGLTSLGPVNACHSNRKLTRPAWALFTGVRCHN